MPDAVEIAAPTAPRQRIAVLDVMRGLAILGIFFMNIPGMGQYLAATPQRIGWGAADRIAFITQYLLLEGTQRGLLELLFGAGLIIMAKTAMAPDGPVEIADVWYRRNLWLIVLGLIHAFGFLWFGEILTSYGLAALLLFPFRTIAPARLFAGGLLALLLFGSLLTAAESADRRTLMAEAPAALARTTAGQTLRPADRAVIKDWQALQAERTGGGTDDKRDAAGHAGSLSAYWQWAAAIWLDWALELPLSVAEAFCTMLIGMAFYRWGIIQGGRSRRFYLGLMLAGYGLGIALRLAALQPVLAGTLAPDWTWFGEEPSRLAVTFGHLAAINLAVATPAGARLLRPFEACGQLPLSVYFMQSAIAMWLLFAPFGLGLWGKLGWANLMLIALAVQALQVIAANLWVRHFHNGGIEWAWKSLAYLRIQPFRRGQPA